MWKTKSENTFITPDNFYKENLNQYSVNDIPENYEEMIGREIYITGLSTNALFQEQVDNQSFMGGSRGEFYLYDADSYSPATIPQNIDNVRSDCSEGVCVKIIDKSQFGSIIDENPEKAKTHGNLVKVLGIVDVTEHGILVKCHDATTSAYDLY